MHNSNSTVFDIIGDVHGHMAKLDSLLQQLGYQHNGEHYYQDGHCAVFVGDLIDKGPNRRRCCSRYAPWSIAATP